MRLTFICLTGIIQLWLGIAITYGQDIDQLLSRSNTYYDRHPQEKLYLHLDKPEYTAGETVWFKVYGTIGVENLLSKLSKIVHVELINPSLQRAAYIRIPLVNGLGVGDIVLPDTITEGSYRLRAYTNWMRNSDDEFFYDRTLSISNGRSDNVTSTVAPVEGKQAYEITLRRFNGNAVTLVPVDFEILENGKTVANFQSQTDIAGRVHLPWTESYTNPVVRYRFQTIDGRWIKKMFKPMQASAKPDVQLLPEGGKLLSGVPNNLGVKVTDTRGLGLQASLFILSGQDTLTRIRTNMLGMGSAKLPIDATQQLRAIALFEDGSTQEVKMPPIYPSGYSLMVDALQSSSLSATLHLSEDLQDGQPLYFIVQHLGKVYHHHMLSANSTAIHFPIAKDSLPTGVLTLTVLNHKLQPVVERPFFHSSPKPPLSLQADKSRYSTREKVTVDVQIAQTPEQPRIGAFSASVVNLDKITKDAFNHAPNVFSSLLLSADIRGFIERPSFYFEGDTIKLKELDNLLLTQGWRNINWSDLDTASEARFAAEQGLQIKGYTRKQGRETAEAGATVRLFPVANISNYKQTTSDANGYFAFGGLFSYEGTTYILNAKDRKGKNKIDIHLENDTLAMIGNNRNAPLERNDVNFISLSQILAYQRYFKQLQRVGLLDGSIWIDEVTVEAEGNKASPRSRNLNRPGHADYIFTSTDFEGYTSLGLLLWDRIGGLFPGWGLSQEWPAGTAVVINGRFYNSETSRDLNIDPRAVESVEVLRSDVYTMAYKAQYSDHDDEMRLVLEITTKPGQSALTKVNKPTGRLQFTPPGIHLNTQYFKPAYEVDSDRSKYTDLRTAIHWEPSIVVNASGKTSFDFFTADESGTYRIILEGLDLNGALIHKELDIKVE